MGLSKHERAERRQREKKLIAAYAKTHAPEEVKRHIVAMRYPSGRWSRGGANRSSSLRREVALQVTYVTRCVTCGGVGTSILLKTSLYPPCTCLDSPA